MHPLQIRGNSFSLSSVLFQIPIWETSDDKSCENPCYFFHVKACSGRQSRFGCYGAVCHSLPSPAMTISPTIYWYARAHTDAISGPRLNSSLDLAQKILRVRDANKTSIIIINIALCSNSASIRINGQLQNFKKRIHTHGECAAQNFNVSLAISVYVTACRTTR